MDVESLRFQAKRVREYRLKAEEICATFGANMCHFDEWSPKKCKNMMFFQKIRNHVYQFACVFLDGFVSILVCAPSSMTHEAVNKL